MRRSGVRNSKKSEKGNITMIRVINSGAKGGGDTRIMEVFHHG